ncbi:hypothetical protein F441_13343 [Phytophthora nicotianae CJ01A1]|uniref:Uncharacterized protein n=2 Tax=Phytophthora nicotianae TaxID=4792 RepID=W2WLV1_PHYNI|nr:hypothetical protein L915_13094 [Phytophthora nicotianae]ETP11113.1 hypothetical protein F441_13343 [Phytophthora nicotianae CJ01A1]
MASFHDSRNEPILDQEYKTWITLSTKRSAR